MKLWASLYAVTWIIFVEFLLGTWPNPPGVVPYLHLVLGLGVVALTYNSFRLLRETRVPGRLKRIARATFGLSVFMVFLGFLIWFDVGARWTLPGVGYTVAQFFLFLHIVNAIAILAQAAALGLAYDMWEDREYDSATDPGEIPPMPTSR